MHPLLSTIDHLCDRDQKTTIQKLTPQSKAFTMSKADLHDFVLVLGKTKTKLFVLTGQNTIAKPKKKVLFRFCPKPKQNRAGQFKGNRLVITEEISALVQYAIYRKVFSMDTFGCDLPVGVP